GKPPPFDIQAGNLRGKSRLIQVALVRIDAEHAVRAAAFHLQRVKSGIATHIQNGFAMQIRRYRMRETLPLDRRIIAEKMMRSGIRAAKIDVVEPLTKFADSLSNAIGCPFLFDMLLKPRIPHSSAPC